VRSGSVRPDEAEDEAEAGFDEAATLVELPC